MLQNTRRARRRAAAIVATLAAASGTVLAVAPRPAPAAARRAVGDPATDPAVATLVGAGDIASAVSDDDLTAAAVEDVLARVPDAVVFTAGDNAYPSGTPADFTRYDATWGRFRDRTRPALGNHDDVTAGAAGYMGYFCPSADDCRFPTGAPQRSYSYDLGPWHVVVLDSERELTAGSAQLTWLAADLAAHPTACTAAVFHRPLFSSGSVHGGDARQRTIWSTLYAAGVDVVLNGHEHHYERFAKLDPSGQPAADGIREFVVGTGGVPLYAMTTPVAGSEVRNTTDRGVLELSLTETGYRWAFRSVAGGTFTDTGATRCNNAPDSPPTVALTGPSDGATVSGDGIGLSAIADDDLGVTAVRFTVDDATVGTATAAPYELAWDSTTVANGPHAVRAVAIDTAGHQTASSAATVHVDNPLPATVHLLDVPISTSKDDAEEQASRAVSLASPTLELGVDGTAQTVGLRFQHIDIPRQATVHRAWLQFTSAAGAPAAPANLTVRAQTTGGVPAFTASAGSVTGRPLTTARATWAVAPWSTTDERSTAQRTPDLSAVLTEVVGRSDWWSGVSVAFMITGTGVRSARSYDGRPAAAPVLHVEWSAPDDTPPAVPPAPTAVAVNANQVDLTWPATADDSGVGGYIVFRNGVRIGTSGTTTFSDRTIAAATTARYSIAAWDLATNVSAAGPSTTVTTRAYTTLTFPAVADATVRSSAPKTNAGRLGQLEADASPLTAFLVRFDVRGLAGRPVVSATLRVRNVDSSDKGGSFVRVAGTAWSETTVTWANAPVPDAVAFASLGRVWAGTWYGVDARAIVTTDGPVSVLVRTPSGDAARYAARESGAATAPRLVVVLA